MTNDDILQREARALGIDERNARVLPLLPLFQLAWAGGAIPAEECAAIRSVLWGDYQLEPAGSPVVLGWLDGVPSGSYLSRGRNLVVALVRRQRGKWAEPTTREELLDVSRTVLRAVTNLFRLRTFATREDAALAAVLDAIGARAGAVWPEVVADPDNELTADAGEFEEDPPTEVGIPRAPSPVSPPSVAPPVQPVYARGITLTRVDTRMVASVTRGGEITIGRTRGNTFQILDDGEVSRRHCRLFDRDGAWFVEDLGSLNGTRVNGQSVRTRQILGGEELLIGISLYRVALDVTEPTESDIQ